MQNIAVSTVLIVLLSFLHTTTAGPERWNMIRGEGGIAKEALAAQKAALLKPQDPGVFDALIDLSFGRRLTVAEQFDLISNAVSGVDYPNHTMTIDSEVDCSDFKQPGFYAHVENPSKCQGFFRCDNNGDRYDFLCPPKTLFNQITLTCDWFFNVDCSKSSKYFDYANSRLEFEDAPLHDTPVETSTSSA